MKALKFTQFCADVLAIEFTPAQRVMWSVLCDGVEPEQLTGDDRDLARKLFGDVDTFPSHARRVAVIAKGARIGGTRFSMTRLVHLGLTTPVKSAAGEPVFGLVIGPDTRLARQGLQFALGAARANPETARRIGSVTSDSFEMVRDDGVTLIVAALPATAGGSAVRGRTLVGAVMTEVSFMRDANSVINDAEIFRALVARIVTGGQLLLESTTYAEVGLLWDFFSKQFGKPTTAMVAHAPTLLMRPDDETRALVEGERLRDPAAAAREFDAEFLGTAGDVFFDASAIDDAVDHEQSQPLRYPGPGTCGRAAGGDIGLRKDSSALVVCLNMRDTCIVALCDEMQPTKGNPLAPSTVYARWISAMSPYQLGEVLLDGHYFESAKEAMAIAGIRALLAPSGSQGKLETYLATKTLLNEGKLILPNHPRLLAQMKSVQSRPTAGGGVRIEVPRRAGNGHGDLVSALTLAAHSIWRINADAPSRNRHAERSRAIFEQLETATGYGGGREAASPERMAEELKWSAANVDRNERILRQQTYRPEEN